MTPAIIHVGLALEYKLTNVLHVKINIFLNNRPISAFKNVKLDFMVQYQISLALNVIISALLVLTQAQIKIALVVYTQNYYY